MGFLLANYPKYIYIHTLQYKTTKMTEQQWQQIIAEDFEQSTTMLHSFIEELKGVDPATARIWLDPIRHLLAEALLDIRQQKNKLTDLEKELMQLPVMKIA